MGVLRLSILIPVVARILGFLLTPSPLIDMSNWDRHERFPLLNVPFETWVREGPTNWSPP